MQNSNLFESGLFISYWSAHRKMLLSKSKECRIAAAIILPCLICLKLVSFTLDCQEKREKNGNRSQEEVLEDCASNNSFEIQHFFKEIQIVSLKKNEIYTNWYCLPTLNLEIKYCRYFIQSPCFMWNLIWIYWNCYFWWKFSKYFRVKIQNCNAEEMQKYLVCFSFLIMHLSEAILNAYISCFDFVVVFEM